MATMTNRNGFAFAHGYAVHWYPTRGVAKHEHYLARKENPGYISKLEPCTEQEAHHWSAPFDARIWG